MAKIKAPNTEYAGVSAGVLFSKGEADTDKPELIEWFRSHGYTVEEPELKKKSGKSKKEA